MTDINRLFLITQDTKEFKALIVPNLAEVIQMIEKTLFRPVSSVSKVSLEVSETGVEAQENTDHSWPPIQGLYEVFVEVISHKVVVP